MTEEEKRQICLLRSNGMSVRKISEYMKVSVSSVQYQCSHNHIADGPVDPELDEKIEERKACAYCGGILNDSGKGRPHRFCSDECRRAYWKIHRSEARKNPKLIYTKVCKYCGKTYEAYGRPDSKYCCHEHYVFDHFGIQKKA